MLLFLLYPLCIFSQGNFNKSPPDEDGRTVSLQTRATEVGQIRSIRINVHYDRSNCDEVCGVGNQCIQSPNSNFGSARGLAGQPVRGRSNYFSIADIHINNTGVARSSGIGAEIARARNIFTYPENRTLFHLVSYNTFERDWYAKSKDLGTFLFPLSSNGLFLMEGRRVYFGEWLTFNPGAGMGSDSRGTLSNLRNVRLPVNNIRNISDHFDSFDEGKGEIGFTKK